MYLNALVKSKLIVYVKFLSLVIYLRTTNYSHVVFLYHRIGNLAKDIARGSFIWWEKFGYYPKSLSYVIHYLYPPHLQ